jgi:hypothetical protein
MRWFRSNLRAGAWCALFALAVQLTLSFGHVHLSGFLRPGSAANVVLAEGGSPPAALPIAPANQKPHGLADDFCAICSLIHLAGTLVTSAPPALPVPTASKALRLGVYAGRDLAAARPDFFQARAPPLS